MRIKASKLAEMLRDLPPDAELEANHPTVDLYVKIKGKPIDLLVNICTPRKYRRKEAPFTELPTDCTSIACKIL